MRKHYRLLVIALVALHLGGCPPGDCTSSGAEKTVTFEIINRTGQAGCRPEQPVEVTVVNQEDVVLANVTLDRNGAVSAHQATMRVRELITAIVLYGADGETFDGSIEFRVNRADQDAVRFIDVCFEQPIFYFW